VICERFAVSWIFVKHCNSPDFYEKKHYRTDDCTNKIDNLAMGESKTEDMIFEVCGQWCG
jgi:hypothetical protein